MAAESFNDGAFHCLAVDHAASLGMVSLTPAEQVVARAWGIISEASLCPMFVPCRRRDSDDSVHFVGPGNR